MASCVAFLQNQWFRNPGRAEKVLSRYVANGDGRHLFVKDMLFLGCLTGRNLLKAFGEELCGRIVWEDVSTRFGSKASDVFQPDFGHIRRVLAEHEPNVVLAFGKVAVTALLKVTDCDPPFVLICCEHPASRTPGTIDRLRLVADRVKLNLV